MAIRTVIDLSDTPIIKDIVARLANLTPRLAGVESVQAETAATAAEALDVAYEALAAAGGGTPTPTPAPVFTQQPTVSGTIQVGQALSILTFTDGVANGTITRAYLLGGVSRPLSYVTQQADQGALVQLRNVATGPGGTTTATSAGIAVQAGSVTPTPSPTLANTRANTTIYQAQDIQGFPARHASLRSTLAGLGATVSANLARLPKAVFDEIDAALVALETPAPAPTIAFDSSTGSVPEGDTLPITITIERDGLTGALTINLTTSGTATSGTDYTALPATLTVPSGQNSVSFNLATIEDTAVESDETIVINATLAGYSATATKTVTITNDDAAAEVVDGPFNLAGGQTRSFDTTKPTHRIRIPVGASSFDGDMKFGMNTGGQNYDFVYVSNGGTVVVRKYRDGGQTSDDAFGYPGGAPANGDILIVERDTTFFRILVDKGTGAGEIFRVSNTASNGSNVYLHVNVPVTGVTISSFTPA